MAYFSNSSEGFVLDEQCSSCIFGEEPCPIALAQLSYNYDDVNNEVATKILNTIVDEKGICKMKEMAKNIFHKDPNQLKLF